jgi:hypothetical protein
MSDAVVPATIFRISETRFEKFNRVITLTRLRLPCLLLDALQIVGGFGDTSGVDINE